MFLLSVDHHLDKFISFRQELYLDTRVDSGKTIAYSYTITKTRGNELKLARTCYHYLMLTAPHKLHIRT